MRRSLIATASTVILFGLLAGPAAAVGKGKDRHSKPAGSIVDVVVGASDGGPPDRNGRDYDILVQAVLATGLAPVLADTEQTYTVFGPDDRAFKRLVRDLSGSTREASRPRSTRSPRRSRSTRSRTCCSTTSCPAGPSTRSKSSSRAR